MAFEAQIALAASRGLGSIGDVIARYQAEGRGRPLVADWEAGLIGSDPSALAPGLTVSSTEAAQESAGLDLAARHVAFQFDSTGQFGVNTDTGARITPYWWDALTIHEQHLLIDSTPDLSSYAVRPWDYDDPWEHTQARADLGGYLFGFLPSGTFAALLSTGLKVAGAELAMALSTPTPDPTIAAEAGNAGADVPFLTDATGATAVPVTAAGLPAGPGFTPEQLINYLTVPVPEYTLAQPGDLIRYTPPADAGTGSIGTVTVPEFTPVQAGDLLHYTPPADAGSLGQLLPSWSDAVAALGVGKAGLALVQAVTGSGPSGATGSGARASPVASRAPAWYDNPGSLGSYAGGGPSPEPAALDVPADTGGAGLVLAVSAVAALLYTAISTR